MKNQYFGDINDYRKYGMLRIFANEIGFKLGVVWMLTPDDTRNDGNITKYLNAPKAYRHYDPDLYDFLYQNVQGNNRTVQQLEQSSLLSTSKFYSPIVPNNRLERQTYFKNMRESFADCELVFFDPDNGLEVQKSSSKHLFYDEVQASFQNKQSLLIYQHYPREARAVFHPKMKSQLQGLTQTASIFILSAASVAYFFVVQEHHLQQAQASLELIKSRWQGQIEISS